jgi:hypothetical protein
MKILGIILAVLMLVGTAFIDLSAANKAHKLAKDIAAVTDGMGMTDDIPSSGRLHGGAFLGVIGGIGAIVLLVATFAKKRWVRALCAVTVAGTVISAMIYPYIPTGPLEGAAPRSLAVVAIVLAIVGAGGAFLAARDRAGTTRSPTRSVESPI